MSKKNRSTGFSTDFKRRQKELAAEVNKREPPPKDRTEAVVIIPQPYLGKGNPVSAQASFSRRFQGLGI